MPKVVVFGGTGYLGSYICKELAKSGFEVVSLSKSGENAFLAPEEIENIRFVKADLFGLSQEWKNELTGASAVVNSIGILFQQRQLNITYKRLIFETTKTIAGAAQEKGVSAFVQISAIKPPLFTFREYHQYKQESEKFLQSQSFKLEIIRPKIIASYHKPLFLFFYRLQELVHFPWKQFEMINDVVKKVVDFLKDNQ